MATTLDQVIALLELLLPEVAGHHRSAVTVHAVGEVLASQADPGSFPVLKLFLIHKTPLLHRSSPLQYSCTKPGREGRSSEFGKAFGITRSAIKNPALGGASELLVGFKPRLRIALLVLDRDPFLDLLHQQSDQPLEHLAVDRHR